MFGLGLKSKTKNILLEYFNYPISDFSKHIFDALVKQGKSMGQNECSIAIAYMMLQMNALLENPGDYKREESEEKEIQDFVWRNAKIIGEVMHLANSPEADIKEILKEIIIKSGLADPDNSPVGDPDQTIKNEVGAEELNKEEKKSFNAGEAMDDSIIRGNYLNDVYSKIRSFIDKAGVPISTPLLERIHKEMEDSGEKVEEEFTWHKLIEEVMSEVAYANGDYLYKNFTSKQAAIFTISKHISSLSDNGALKEIKKDQPDLYDSLQKLWNLCGFLATDTETEKEYRDVVIVPKDGNPFN